MLLAITNDLMAAAPIEQGARLAGLECRCVGTKQLRDMPLGSEVRLVVLDLNAADQVADTVASIRKQAAEGIPIVAFGPHVHATKLQAAKDAGCTKVLTRGQFHQNAAKAIADALATGDTE